MPKLFMIKETYDYDERELIPDYEYKYIELIKKYISQSEVYIFGKYDLKFWEEVVLSKPGQSIMDPIDEFPVILIENITHFGAISFNEHPDKEYYYGNSNHNLEEFTKILLTKAIKKYEVLREGAN